VHDHVMRIDQHPIALRQAFDVRRAVAPFLQPSRQILGQRRDVARRTPRRDDNRIGER
jgi:hypothetical protein